MYWRTEPEPPEPIEGPVFCPVCGFRWPGVSSLPCPSRCADSFWEIPVTDPNYTAIAMLVDRSGSMHDIADDAEGAIEAFIADQREVEGKATIRLSDFDTEYRNVYLSLPLIQAPAYHLQPRGSTALLDSIHRLVTEFGRELAELPEAKRPGKVLVIIQTDGHENASMLHSREDVFKLITRQRTEYGWEFVFLGANQDAIATGAGLGIPRHSTMTFAATEGGTRAMGQSVSAATRLYRGAGAGGQSVSFTDEDRLAAMDDAVSTP